MDHITLIKLIVGFVLCALPLGYGIYIIVELKRIGRQLEALDKEEFPTLSSDDDLHFAD